MPSPVHFRTNVLLKSIIGKDLINNDNIAVLELVKNSFDAGSKAVTVTFKNIASNDDAIASEDTVFSSAAIIQDWGCGMDMQAIKERWLNIAYSEKKYTKRQGGRLMAGAKGIGRFSCDRLGEYLNLYTKKAGGTAIHLRVNWRKFEVENAPDTSIQSVSMDVREIPDAQFAKETGFKPFRHGTILEIRRLRTAWTEDRLLSLRRYLERLINPNQQFSRSSFLLELIAPDFGPDVNGEIKNQIFSKLDFTCTAIESAIDAKGERTTTVLRDKGREVFRLVEKNKFTLLKDVRLNIYFLNQYAKGYFKRLTGVDKVQFGSIFLFVNGFRIPPYGEEKDDWLGLDRHKGQAYARNLGTREVIGRIEIDDPDGSYKIVSSREGLVRDARFDQIAERDGFYYKIHRRLEKYVAEGLDWDRAAEEHVKAVGQKMEDKRWKFDPADEIYSDSDAAKRRRVVESLSSVLGAEPSDVISLTIDPELIQELAEAEQGKAEEILRSFDTLEPKFGRTTREATEHVRRAFERQSRALARSQERQARLVTKVRQLQEENSLAVSENLFLRSATRAESKEVLALQHQIGLSAVRIDTKVHDLRRAIEQGKPKDLLFKLLNTISFENKKIQTTARYVTKAQFEMVVEDFEGDLVKFIRQYVENVCVEDPRWKQGGQPEVKVTADAGLVFERTFQPLEFSMLFDNLLDNARKARATAVSIALRRLPGGSLAISVRDNGRGVDERFEKRIFDFGFTTTDGAGIGLYHAAQILRRIGGTIEYRKPDGAGAEFFIQVPK